MHQKDHIHHMLGCLFYSAVYSADCIQENGYEHEIGHHIDIDYFVPVVDTVVVLVELKLEEVAEEQHYSEVEQQEAEYPWPE